MKRFLLMHIGFETPTPEVMNAWNKWFENVASHTIENAGLRNGREIGRDGVIALPMAPDSITGFTVISAESMEKAEELASSNPFVRSIRIYELVSY